MGRSLFLPPLFLLAATAFAAELTAHQRLAFDIYKELVEIRTVPDHPRRNRLIRGTNAREGLSISARTAPMGATSASPCAPSNDSNEFLYSLAKALAAGE